MNTCYNGFKKGLVKMSVQSDCTWLYYMVAYEYAEKHNLSDKSVIQDFEKYQIMEKLISQHEYLHQVAFCYVEEYIEECMAKKSPEIVVYHGTIEDFKNIDISRSNNNRDFGKGFYTTVIETQAKNWGKNLATRFRKKEYFVKEYSFMKIEGLRIKKFAKIDREWLDMVASNRKKGGIQHDYDVVSGPVADDNTMQTVQRYVEGLITAEDALKKLEYSSISNQISFHTEKALESLYKGECKRYEIE